MACLEVAWWIAGGWAIDLFLNRSSRDHVDTDVLVLRRDQVHVYRHFSENSRRDRTWRPMQSVGGMSDALLPSHSRLTQLVAQYGLGETKAFADHHAEQANLENRYLLELLRRRKPLAVEKRCLEGIEFLRRGNQEAD